MPDAPDESPPEEPAGPFSDLAPPVRQALIARGFSDLTVVQRAVLFEDARHRDLQISSQTGSGKTVAIGLVLSHRLLELAEKAPSDLRRLQALLIVPTRELAVQVSSELTWLFAAVPSITIASVTGGSSVVQEKRLLAKKPTILVGTPGRLLDHLRSKALDASTVAELILDEADRMLDMGFREELEAILQATPSERRTHLVSATFPTEIQKLAHTYQRKPLTVQGTRLGAANEDIEHVGHLVRPRDRYAALVNLLLMTGDERTLIFVRTRAGASELAEKLARDGFLAAPLSGELEQNQRTRTLEAFRTGHTHVLVATDVAARGLDIPDVGMVLHTDVPFDAESYTHRSGRTGRAGKKGRSVLLSTPPGQRKLDMLLSRAKVKLVWRDVPTAQAVEKALLKRERRRLREALTAAPVPSEQTLSFVDSLLEGMEAKELLARLIDLSQRGPQAKPQHIEPVAKSSPPTRTARGPAGLDDGPAPRPRSGGTDRRSNHSAEPLVAALFEMNWGMRTGATPQRILATVCRRGQITSRAVGAIEVGPRSTIFEIDPREADAFEHYAATPDERSPWLSIRRHRMPHRPAHHEARP